ncbi:hypothetical protein QR98_0015310, partial [Sarcoptes scabiei]
KACRSREKLCLKNSQIQCIEANHYHPHHTPTSGFWQIPNQEFGTSSGSGGDLNSLL